MLDTGFVRLPGDIGQPASHAGPVLFETVPQASAARVVGGIASLTDPAQRAAALKPFIAAGKRLVARGAMGITTSCGFLVTYQAELQAALPVPVMTSALCLLPEIGAGRLVGILTFDAASLGAMHLRAAGFEGECAITGLAPGAGFRREVLEDSPEADVAGREADVLEAAGRLPGMWRWCCWSAPISRRIARPWRDRWACLYLMYGMPSGASPSCRGAVNEVFFASFFFRKKKTLPYPGSTGEYGPSAASMTSPAASTRSSR
jgi:hypothetical protein